MSLGILEESPSVLNLVFKMPRLTPITIDTLITNDQGKLVQ